MDNSKTFKKCVVENLRGKRNFWYRTIQRSPDFHTHFTLLHNAKRVYPRILQQNRITPPLPGSNEGFIESAMD
jgi:hypothetical protein